MRAKHVIVTYHCSKCKCELGVGERLEGTKQSITQCKCTNWLIGYSPAGRSYQQTKIKNL